MLRLDSGIQWETARSALSTAEKKQSFVYASVKEVIPNKAAGASPAKRPPAKLVQQSSGRSMSGRESVATSRSKFTHLSFKRCTHAVLHCSI